MSSKNGATAVATKTKPRFSIEPDSSRCQSKIETWTPDKAKRQLEMNPANRPINEAFVLELAQAIENGEWQLNGETIKINIDGNIVDGQHRLSAIVLSGRDIQSLTVRGLPVASFDTVDRGVKRSIGHILAVHGQVNTTCLAAAISWVWKYQTGSMRKTGRMATPRSTQAMVVLDKNRDLTESARIMASGKCCRILAPGIAAAFHYLLGKVNAEKADAFFNGIITGEGLKRGTGVHTLRERLLDNKSSKAKVRPLDICAYIVKAWNADYEGKTCRVLRFGDEDFPRIAGLK